MSGSHSIICEPPSECICYNTGSLSALCRFVAWACHWSGQIQAGLGVGHQQLPHRHTLLMIVYVRLDNMYRLSSVFEATLASYAEDTKHCRDIRVRLNRACEPIHVIHCFKNRQSLLSGSIYTFGLFNC
jgi:hypothetical protein